VLIDGWWDEIAFDVAIADEVFDDALPAGVVVRTHSEVLYDHLAAQGVDMSGVDALDEVAVQELAQASARSRHGGLLGADPGEALAQYVPDGPPPADRGVAEAAVVAALARFAEREGDDAPNVEQGGGLASVLDDAASRTNYQHASLSVTAVRFLNDHEAMVVASVHVDGATLLPNGVHRAVLEAGRWKLARSSLAQLLTFTGVQLPPPAA
jgi:hypothetical protein